MTVRYRSATLNEFIEHHSYDVSRGGLFIKTPSPFAPGTLLKFEVKIAEDQRVLQGVGRVVWKRDAGVGPEEPAGMGIKFIKLDDASKAVIERLIASRGDDTVSAFDRSPDSRSHKLFPDFGESFNDDPTVVRPRSDVEQDASPLPPSGSGVNPLLSVPVPSGPALSVGAPVSLPFGIDMGPNSLPLRPQAPSAALPMPSAAPPMSRAPVAGASVPPLAGGADVGVRPRSGAPMPSQSAQPASQSGQHRKPGPMPVTSAPPPKSGSGYIWLLLGAALAGGGFLYLKLNRHLLRPEAASSSQTTHTTVIKPASPPPEAPAAQAVLAPVEPAPSPSQALDLDAIKPEAPGATPAPADPTPASPASAPAEPPEAKAAPVEPAAVEAAVAAKPVARRKRTPKEASPSDTNIAPAGADVAAAPAESAKPEPTPEASSPPPQEPAAPPAPPEPAAATPPQEDEFR
jgi:uncharacterized protein (TIGR02266 family)